MRSPKLSCGVYAVLLLAGAPRSETQVQAADGIVVARYGASHWDGTPEADLVGTEFSNPASDVLVESGWWLRIQGIDTREVPLPTPSGMGTNSAPATWQGFWEDLRGSGLLVLENVTSSNSEGPSGTYVSRVVVINVDQPGAQPVQFSMFHYLNPDPDAGTLGAQEGAVASASTPNMISIPGVRIVNGQPVSIGEIHYRAGNADHRACRPDSSPVSALLNDAVADDLDNSGLPTALTSAGVNCAYQWTNITLNPNQVGSFAISVSSGLPRLSVKGDFDADNMPDLLFKERSTGAEHVWNMLRTEFRSSDELDFVPGKGGILDDFNRDFEDDVLSRDPSTGVVTVSFRHSGVTGGFFPLNAPTLGLNWALTSTADFNGDGYPDLLWRNLTSQKLVAWTMNGINKLDNLIPTPGNAANVNWEIVGVNDIDRDGHPDFVWYNTTSGNIVIWYMDANLVRITGAFTTPADAGGAGWRVVASGDYGRGSGSERPAVTDGIDLIWQNQISDKLVVWHMNLAGERTSGSFTSPGVASGYSVIGPR